jgi:serine/threonine protein kinase
VSENHRDEDQTQSFVPLSKGTEVSHYKIISKIGAGGMGEVYLSEDTALKRRVALKFLPHHYASDQDLRERFKREAQAAAKLDHPNIVPVYEVGEYQGRPYFAMAHIEGQSLRDIIKEGKLGINETIDLTMQICEGLHEAHVAGIVHRDIKPGNIIIDSKGRPRLVDFGLAIVSGENKLTKTGSTLGTVGYMSPEQVEGKKVNQRSDLFSVGVILYEMLTGRRPFEGDNDAAVVKAISCSTPEPIARFKSGTTGELQKIIDKALSKDPAFRYQHADGIVSDLRRMTAKDSPISLSADATGKRPSWRTSILIAIPVILILAVLVFKPWSLIIAPSDKDEALPQRLAVLYLQNRGSADDEYLSYGITEDLIVDLTRVGTIGVAPMRLVVEHKDSRSSLEKIAKQLHVNLVVDGSIHRQDSIISVSLQLIDIRSGKNLWADRWSDNLASLPDIKEWSAKGISEALEFDSARVHAAQIGDPDAENPLAYDYYLRGKYAFADKKDATDVKVAKELLRKALELEPSLLAARIRLADVYNFKGEYDPAINELSRALSEARKRNEHDVESWALKRLAKVHQNLVHWDTAYEHINQALELSRSRGDLNGELWALLQKIDMLSDQRMLDSTLVLFDRVAEINQIFDDQSALYSAFNEKGFTYVLMGMLDSAKINYDRAMEIAKKLDRLSLICAVYSAYGTLYSKWGNNAAAFEHYNKALEINRKLDYPEGIAATLTNLATLHQQEGNYHKDEVLMEEAAAIYKEMGNNGAYAQCLNGVAGSSMNRGEYDRSITIYHDLQKVMHELNDLFWLSVIHQNMGFAYFYKGEPGAARKNFCESLRIKEDLGVEPSIAFAAASIGEFFYFQGNLDSCRKYAEKSLVIAGKITATVPHIWSSVYLGALLVKEGSFDDGIAQLRSQVRAADSLGYAELLIISNRLLGQALVESGKTDVEVADGHKALKDALALAQEKSIAHEISWITELLQKYEKEHGT